MQYIVNLVKTANVLRKKRNSKSTGINYEINSSTTVNNRDPKNTPKPVQLLTIARNSVTSNAIAINNMMIFLLIMRNPLYIVIYILVVNIEDETNFFSTILN
jgi:hypothetical protein